MSKYKCIQLIIGLMAIPFIVACNSEPSENDIKKAIEDSYSQNTNSVFSSKMGEVIISSAGIKNIKLENVEKINCISQAKNAYFCEYAIEYTVKANDGSLAELFGVNGKKRSISRSRFLKTSKSWMLSDE